VTSFQGVVLERWTGRPVEGATVILDGYMATTDADGTFYFPDVPPKVYTMRVIHKDYRETRLNVDLTAGGTLSISQILLTPVFKALPR